MIRNTFAYVFPPFSRSLFDFALNLFQNFLETLFALFDFFMTGSRRRLLCASFFYRLSQDLHRLHRSRTGLVNLDLILGPVNSEKRKDATGPGTDGIDLAAFSPLIIKFAGQNVLEVQDARPVGVWNGVLLEGLIEGNLEVLCLEGCIFGQEPYGVAGSAACPAPMALEQNVAGHADVIN